MNRRENRDIFIGLMSGTSLDGVDVGIVEFAAASPHLLHFESASYDDDLRDRLRALVSDGFAALDDFYALDAELGERYAACVNSALAQASLEPRQITAIGCHGQTLRHGPDARRPYSAQIGDPNRVAALTGIATVADFRRMDMAYGGQGAPLASACHAALFRSTDEDRVALNIGGIANLTWLPADPDSPVLGFDTGPGNTLLDQWAQRHIGERYDADGAWARSGQVLDSLLEKAMSQEPYFATPAPKSTGTEYFDLAWLERFVADDSSAVDVQATLIELTARSVAAAISTLPARPAACFICGGGAHNDWLLERLAQALGETRVTTTAELGLEPDAVEAVAFAWLARERLAGRPGNLPSVTHAQRAAILGGVYLPG